MDLGSAHFSDCSCLHALARFTRELAAASRPCRIVGAQPETGRLIGMANLAGDLQLDGMPTPPTGRRTRAMGTPLPAGATVTGCPVAGGLVAAGSAR